MITLEECTKEELIFIIKHLTHFNKDSLNHALNDVEFQRVKKKLDEAERWSQVSDSCRKRYCEIAKKYAGKNMRVIEVPTEDLIEMNECLENAKKADRKYDKLMKEVDAYGSSDNH